MVFNFILSDDVIVRGCAVHLTPVEYAECTDEENDQCIYCTAPNCNTALPSKSNSASLRALLSLIFAAFIATLVAW